jgi:hypothetical protein
MPPPEPIALSAVLSDRALLLTFNMAPAPAAFLFVRAPVSSFLS